MSVRVRVALTFAIATMLVLAGAFLFVYLRLSNDLDDSIDATLHARSVAASELFRRTSSLDGFPLEDPEESFVAVIDLGGHPLVSVGGVTDVPFSPSQLKATSRGTVTDELVAGGIDGRARIRADRLSSSDVVVIAGQSLTNRNEALSDVRRSFGIGVPLAVLVGAVLGYWLAALAFRPVERMRATAATVSVTADRNRLPVPRTRDEIRRLADTLNGMLDRLRDSVDRERRFVADASHELRTPIAIIKTELESAVQNSGDAAAIDESLRAALDECDGLAQLADDLLVLARDAEVGIIGDVATIFVADVFRDVHDRFVDRARRQHRVIDVEVEASATIQADPLRIRQALSNLVDNALRHGAGAIVLRTASDEEFVNLDVGDDGPGFDAEFAEQAFERFTRGPSRRASSGAGLGLAIVRAIAVAHEGRVTIVREAPPVVRISLPRRRGDASQRDRGDYTTGFRSATAGA